MTYIADPHNIRLAKSQNSLGERTTLYSGSAPLQQIIAEEVVVEHNEPNQERPEDVDPANTLEEGDLASNV